MLLVPSKYKIIKEESTSKLDEMDINFELPISVNCEISLSTFKSDAKQKCDSDCSEDDDDILFNVYKQATKNRPRKIKKHFN